MLSNAVESVAALAADVSAVLDTDLTRCSDGEMTQILQAVERCVRRLGAFATDAVVELQERSIPRRAGCTSTASYLQDVLRLSRREANARVSAAKNLGTWHDVGGYSIPVDLPATSEAVSSGDVSDEHARTIAAVRRRVPVGLPREHWEDAERILVECAKAGTPEDVQKAGDRVIGYLDPDGKLTDERDRKRRRGIRIGKQRDDLMSPISGEIDPTLRALLDALLAKQARAGMNNPDRPIGDQLDPSTVAESATADVRTAPQRNHDALHRICEMALESGAAGSHRGLPVTAIITMTIDQLEDAAGVATTATGGRVPVSDALRLAEKTRPWLAVFDHAGRPLHFGRGSRLASIDQRLMLIPFDRGCTKPGCDKPPSLCAVHHSDEWIDGGATDIENETFACDGCHALVTGTETGWQTVKVDEDHEYPGRTLWIPPAHVDPERRPRINHCHHPDELLDRAIQTRRTLETVP